MPKNKTYLPETEEFRLMSRVEKENTLNRIKAFLLDLQSRTEAEIAADVAMRHPKRLYCEK